MRTTVRITGLRETVRAFNQIDRSVSREVQKELKRAAEPVASEARGRIGKYQGASTATIRPRARLASVWVTQNARAVTGTRGDFGALQMRHLIRSLDGHEDEVVRGVDQALDTLINRAGF